ncbi:MAG: beta-1,4-galactosyltransferase [Betaproteobacteria bacterium]|nr:MAG: beta-1,4-galactosyltransferase [Betaproteobacteria bacterium]
MSTFVAVGTGRAPFMRLLAAVDELAKRSALPAPVKVQCGHTRFSSRHCTVVPFPSMDEFERAVSDAELVVCQAGGGTVLLANLAGKVPVVVPRLRRHGEVVDDHQVANARALEEGGNAVAVYDIADLEAATKRALAAQRAAIAKRQPSALLAAVAGDLALWDRQPD